MAPPRIRPSSAPPSHSQTPHSDMSRRAEAVRTAVISILKDTDWPKVVTDDVQALIKTMNALADIDKVTTNETKILGDPKVSIKSVLNELESVHLRLKEESDKYGAKKSVLRRGFKKLVSRPDATRCSGVLKACRSDVEKSSVILKSLFSNPDTTNEQHFSKIAEGQTTVDSRLPGTQTPPATATLAPTAAPNPAASPAYSDNPQLGSTQIPEATQASSTGPSKEKGSSRCGKLLSNAKQAFKFAEALSGALPVVGSYVGAVAKVGSTVVDMIQAMDDNDETAEKLGSHVYRLSNILEKFSNQPRQSESSQTAKEMEDLQQALRDVKHEIAEQQSQLGVSKFWNSSDQSGSLKKLQEKVRVALEEIELLTNLKTSFLVEELR
ncbi:hypothetical protein FS837_002952 [Tulasnella sp. UAMH 9824]|nr:hypothetical protein FS837_002952 [Tulasnella sp. UAMH 9824]